MEILGLLALGVAIGIPAIAIVALVRSKAAESRAEENSDAFSNLEREFAGLRREMARLSERVTKLESASVPTLEPAPVPVKPSTAPVQVSAATESVNAHAEHKVEPAVVPARVVEAKKPEPTEQVNRKEPAFSAPSSSTVKPPTQRPQAPPFTVPSFAAYEPAKPQTSVFERLKTNLPLEQFLGMNLFAKIGIVLLVLGFALLGRLALISMGPAERVALIYAVTGVLLGGGIWLEKRERYRLVGRTGIGGGWALFFFTTYAMHHVAPMTVLRSNTLDCILMLIVAVAMVAHTLRYRSQLVTGLAFLLAFSTVALSQDSVYALVAGLILALGIVAIALRMSWFELEVFGILASYANHFYWLYKLYPEGVAGHPFPQFWSSVVILVLYWAVFRVSYVLRVIRSKREESISTIAALANTMLLLAVMKFQSTHPEWAFYALLILGALEFSFGQLPVTRRRRAAFALLSVVGTLLTFAAVPFKFSGNNIALFWMIAAEALLVAGIVQRESLFRRLGLLAGCMTGALIAIEAGNIVELRMSSEAMLLKDGVLLFTSSAMFYLNALFLRRKWEELFGKFEAALATCQSYLGCITAFLATWALLTADWTALGWAVLLLGAAFGARRLRSTHLLAQGWALAIAVAVRALVFNCRFDVLYPHHVGLRLLTLPMLAAMFYAVAWMLTGVRDLPFALRTYSLWAGSALLAMLAWLELPQAWVAPVWIVLAVGLCLVGRRLRLASLTYQEHVLAVAAVAQLIAVNIDAARAIDRYLPLIGCAAAFYVISRFCTQTDASYRRPAAWLHTWTATALLAALTWHESPQPWITVIWILFALALAIIDRIRSFEELPWQAHVLAILAVVRAVTLNYFLTGTWHGVHIRLISIAILVTGLYMLARWVRLPETVQSSDMRHAYTWVGSGLAAWLLWAELQPISVALGLGVFGLALFEIGAWREQKQLRLQAYALLTASFARIFFVNLTAAKLSGDLLSPRIYTVVPLALIYFYVWARLQSTDAKPEGGPVRSLIAYFGSGSIVALLYCQVVPEWIVAAWAFVVVALMAAALAFDKEVFLDQSILLTAGIVVRSLAHNIFGSSYFTEGGWRGRFSAIALTAALLFATLPIAFRLRRRYADRPRVSFVSRSLAARRPEQILFFVPLMLIVLTIAVKMNPGMVTLSWGIVGVAVIVLGLLVSERSYRLAGLFLLLLCVGKIVFRDAWRLDDRDRYITFIVLGAALTLVSALYSKYRDQVSRLL